MIFLPPAVDNGTYHRFEMNELTLHEDGKSISGWKKSVNSNQSKTILYFGGNAEDVVFINFEAVEYEIKQLISFNYPGYGKSEGKPSQDALYNQAQFIYQQLIEQYQVKSENIIVMGRSLGSSVASYVASRNKVAGLILITPFDSLQSVASNHYKIFPVRWLLKHAFATDQFIAEVTSPVLILAAENDEIIADKNLRNLESRLQQDAKVIRYKNVGHNTIQSHPDYYLDINNFIKTL